MRNGCRIEDLVSKIEIFRFWDHACHLFIILTLLLLKQLYVWHVDQNVYSTHQSQNAHVSRCKWPTFKDDYVKGVFWRDRARFIRQHANNRLNVLIQVVDTYVRCKYRPRYWCKDNVIQGESASGHEKVMLRRPEPILPDLIYNFCAYIDAKYIYLWKCMERCN